MTTTTQPKTPLERATAAARQATTTAETSLAAATARAETAEKALADVLKALAKPAPKPRA